MDEPMLKARVQCSGAASDDGSAILSSTGNRRKSILNQLMYGPCAFHLALCSLVLNLCLGFLVVWLWRFDMPAKLAAIEGRGEVLEAQYAEQKRVVHFLRKEVMFASSRVNSMSAYEAFRKTEDEENFYKVDPLPPLGPVEPRMYGSDYSANKWNNNKQMKYVPGQPSWKDQTGLPDGFQPPATDGKNLQDDMMMMRSTAAPTTGGIPAIHRAEHGDEDEDYDDSASEEELGAPTKKRR